MARVIVKEGTSQRIVELVDRITIAGRALENKIVLQDRQSSRRHCQFEKIDWGVKLIDLESRNGTRVNDRTVNQALLRPGDCVQVGQALMIFEDPDFREPPPEVVARFGPPAPSLAAAAPTPLASPIPSAAAAAPPPPPPPPVPPPAPASPAPQMSAPVPPPPPPAPAEPLIRRRGTPTTRIDRGFRAAMYERLREQKIITCVGVGAALFGLLIVLLIVFSLASGGDPAGLQAARDNFEKARELRVKDPDLAMQYLRKIPPDQQPYSNNARQLMRQIEADRERQRAVAGEAEQKEFRELEDFCERNRGNPQAYERMYTLCAEYRRKYPSSPFLAKIDEYQKVSAEGRLGAMRAELRALEGEVAERLPNNEFAAALVRVKEMLEKYKAEIEAREPIMKVHDEVVDRARAYWEAQDARARELKDRGQKDEARRAYEEAFTRLGEGKVEELKDFCTLAQACLETLR